MADLTISSGLHFRYPLSAFRAFAGETPLGSRMESLRRLLLFLVEKDAGFATGKMQGKRCAFSNLKKSQEVHESLMDYKSVCYAVLNFQALRTAAVPQVRESTRWRK